MIDEVRWWRDVFPRLYHNDCLWVNMIQGREWLRCVDQAHVNDLVLMDLLQIGIFDWKVLGFCLYPINPGKLSSQCCTGVDRCTPKLPR